MQWGGTVFTTQQSAYGFIWPLVCTWDWDDSFKIQIDTP